MAKRKSCHYQNRYKKGTSRGRGGQFAKRKSSLTKRSKVCH